MYCLLRICTVAKGAKLSALHKLPITLDYVLGRTKLADPSGCLGAEQADLFGLARIATKGAEHG